MFGKVAVTFVCLLSAILVRAQDAATDGLVEELQAIKLARGANLNLLVSRRVDTRPTTAVLLFPGYPGILKLRREGDAIQYDLKGNFLVRARRHLNTDRIFTVLVDCPDDQWNDCGDHFRTSEQHLADIEAAIDLVRRRFGSDQVYIAGTSYGTLSSAVLAAKLTGRIDGAIHTATFSDPKFNLNAHGQPLRNFDWSRATVPQLLVHHRDDPCAVTRYDGIAERRGRLPLITVRGAVSPRGDACNAYTQHGFVGREAQVMKAMAGWILERAVPESVGEP